MTRTALLAGVLLAFEVNVAQAQPRFYVGTSTAVDGGERGNIPGGAVPSVGGVVGFQLSERWSLELEVERGFRTTTAGSGESVLESYPPPPIFGAPSREVFEAYGVRTRNERTQRAGTGFSALVVYRSAEQGRVSAGLFGGVSARNYRSTLQRTTTWVSPIAVLPPNYRPPDEHSARDMTGGGITAGVLVFVRLTPHVSIAPEVRYTGGLITDDPYSVVRTGVRAIWRF